MMLRRPPGEGRHVVQQQNNRKFFWVLAALLLPVLPLVEAVDFRSVEHQPQPPALASPSLATPRAADPQPHHHADQHGKPARPRAQPGHESPLEGDNVIRNLAATALTQHDLDTPHVSSRRKRTNTQSVKEEQPPTYRQQRNLQTYDASAISAAAPDLPQGRSVRAPSPMTTDRSIDDWEVEDFVLLATIDGDLYASDRRTGKERWHISLGQSMVETKHHRQVKSPADGDVNTIWDQSIWAIEPTGDGEIYMYVPGKTEGVMSTGLSMKELVEKMSPYENKEYGLVYTGKKETNILALDAATGRAIRWFGPTASTAEDFDSCPRPLDPVASIDSEECYSGTITLGRTEYTVGISNPRGYPVATLKYSEWSPNIKDEDLMRQYSTTMDKLYITSRHDGRVYGFDFDRDAERRQSFVEHFPTPIARAFDVVRPARSYNPYEEDDKNAELVALPQPALPAKDEHEALVRSSAIFLDQIAGNWYAMSARAYPLITKAPVALMSDLDWFQEEEKLAPSRLSEVLVGQHFLGKPWTRPRIPLLPGSSNLAESDIPQLDGPRQDHPDVPTLATDAPNPSSTVIERVKKLPQEAANSAIEAFTNPFVALLFMTALFVYRHEIIRRVKGVPKQSVRWTKGVLKQQGFNVDLDEDSSDETPETQVVENDQGIERSAPEQVATAREVLNLEDETHTDPATPRAPIEVAAPIQIHSDVATDVVQAAPEVKKKKAHRGRRGGKQHRKNKKGDNGSADDETLNDVEEAVNMAKKLGETARGPEPDIQTVPDDVGNVSVPILKIDDSLEVIQEQQLGTGSNGTIVFAGKWQDRPVAVKRMLRSFYDIATRETRLLREVDLHPNVIRYYAQLERGDFIYIALQLCEASLADVVEKPSHFRALAELGSKNPLGVLKQITKGLDHLHSLQIVHRDLKPQNILITTDMDGEPLILVSDFGLCKKLENGQSSLGATTAHNADASSTHSGTASSSQQQGENRRRVTRSIDIFSLGIVFFYVLTQGSHPFDCGGSFMREVNIRKGTYSLDRLEVLGEYQQEATHLIEKMISANPKERPKTKDILVHPFFWSAEKRLTFLCDVSDAFEREPRDPPSLALQALEEGAHEVIPNGDFLSRLHKDFVNSLGKQRKYTGSRLLDLLRALRNKKNHFRDMPEALQEKIIGHRAMEEGYLLYWTTRFPDLLLYCWNVVRHEDVGYGEDIQLRKYYQLRRPE
ncbi:putative serine threonine kinase irei [Diaporthe ampelina]|uniref:non-specific serine/threonine protein kinase n=1 Tax=Diaporthe ampelina TaxID=1214573 RepID=A0A0G2HWB9_9PEZI|nr:putative serine threonine kinase irei [Diaporthe ampelina]